MKIVAGLFGGTLPYFCWQLVFYRHLPTSGRQNTVKKGPQPHFIQKSFVPLCITAFPSQYLASFSSWRPKSKKIIFFTNFHFNFNGRWKFEARAVPAFFLLQGLFFTFCSPDWEGAGQGAVGQLFKFQKFWDTAAIKQLYFIDIHGNDFDRRICQPAT